MSVKLWTCFHCKLDKDTAVGKGVFCSSGLSSARSALTDQQLAVQLEKSLRKSAPKGFRGGSSTAQGLAFQYPWFVSWFSSLDWWWWASLQISKARSHPFVLDVGATDCREQVVLHATHSKVWVRSVCKASCLVFWNAWRPLWVACASGREWLWIGTLKPPKFVHLENQAVYSRGRVVVAQSPLQRDCWLWVPSRSTSNNDWHPSVC